MRFRFCGGLDCPDWVLAEINTLARLTSVKMKLLVSQVLKSMNEGKLDFEKVEKITLDAKLGVGGVKASVAGLEFILSSATKHDIGWETLLDELQQLGLPKEHSVALCKSFERNVESLREKFLERSLRRSGRVVGVDWKINPGVGGSRVVDVRVSMGSGVVSFAVEESKLKQLLDELKQVQTQIEQIEI
nr:COMM domain-containing protein 4-like [Ciona intestinalis]|eukprot:XP_009861974.1 COMM domain-containing protein 4-like [Ciona intestinalis]